MHRQRGADDGKRIQVLVRQQPPDPVDEHVDRQELDGCSLRPAGKAPALARRLGGCRHTGTTTLAPFAGSTHCSARPSTTGAARGPPEKLLSDSNFTSSTGLLPTTRRSRGT